VIFGLFGCSIIPLRSILRCAPVWLFNCSTITLALHAPLRSGLVVQLFGFCLFEIKPKPPVPITRCVLYKSHHNSRCCLSITSNAAGGNFSFPCFKISEALLSAYSSINWLMALISFFNNKSCSLISPVSI